MRHNVSSVLVTTWLLLAVGTLQLAVAVSNLAADEPESWLIAPPATKTLSPADQAARDALLKLIEAKQTKEFRKKRTLTVPLQASGVPQNYDLLVYQEHSGWTNEAVRLEIQVRGERANFELCDGDGIFQAELPSAEIDQLARQLVYAFWARERLNPGHDDRWGFSGVFDVASHTVEVISRDEKFPLHLKTPHWQAMADSIGLDNDGIRGFAHTRFVDRAHSLARTHCQLVDAEQEKRAIVQRLKALPVDKPADKPAESKRADSEPTEFKRAEITLAQVDRLVFGALAVQRGMADALPELKRLGLTHFHRQLSISSLPDPASEVKRAIIAHKTDPELSRWALGYATDRRHRDRLVWLLDVLPQKTGYEMEILRHLGDIKLTPDQLAQLQKYYEAEMDRANKVDAALALLKQTDKRVYFDFLVNVVRHPAPGDLQGRYNTPRSAAANHLFRYTSETGKRRDDTYPLLKLLLDEPRQTDTPDSFEMFQLVRFLGKLGSAADLPYLTRLAESKSVYLSSDAIEAMAEIDAKAALAQLHKRLERLNRRKVDSHDYSHEVFSHFSLIVFERDTAAIPLLKQAWKSLLANEERVADWHGYDPQSVLNFLEAKTGPERLEAALAHFGERASYEDLHRRKRFVAKLIAEGADPKRSELLLKDYQDEWMRGR